MAGCEWNLTLNKRLEPTSLRLAAKPPAVRPAEKLHSPSRANSPLFRSLFLVGYGAVDAIDLG